MTAKAKPQVLAVGSDHAFELARKALGDTVQLVRAQPAPEAAARRDDGADLALAVVCCAAPRAAAFVNVRRLTREYGEPVASEVLRQVVATQLAAPQERAASRRTR